MSPRSPGGMGWRRRSCLGAALAMLGGGLCPPPPAIAAPADQGMRRRLRFMVSLANPSARELADPTLWFYLPAHAPAGQRLLGAEASVPMQVLSDPLGHRIAQIRLPRLTPFARQLVSVAVQVEIVDGPVMQPLEDAAGWLANERFIETADPAIRALAMELRREGPLRTAQAIYEWVRTQLRYEGYVADDRGAAQALAQRRGDCTEYAFLAVALARANGIAARMVGGFVVAGDAAPRAQDYHNWAQLHLDGAWRLLDAQKERWLVSAEPYIAFRYYRDAVLNPVERAHRFQATEGLEVRW